MKRFELCIAAALIALPAGSSQAQPVGKRDPWAGAWGYAPAPPPADPAPVLAPGMFRYRIRLTQSGSAVTLRFSSPEQALPLAIASATITTAKGRQLPLRFSGRSDVRIETGTSRTTDPLPIRLRAGQDLTVTVTTAAPTTDVVANAGFLTEYTPTGSARAVVSKTRPFVSLVSVRNADAPCTIVALGDSITEGARGTEPAWRGWPGRLARKLIARSPKRHCGVVNMGMSGNRLLREGRGPSAIDRFDRDVLAVPGATHLVLLIGINDIQRSRADPIAAAELIAGYRQIIDIARAHGLKVIGGTLTPGEGSRYLTPQLEQVRAEANRWIRESRAFDAVIDFEAAVRQPGTSPRLRPDHDSGDMLHPGDAGHTAMADAVDPALFDRP